MSVRASEPQPEPELDTDLSRIVAEEDKVLRRVQRALAARRVAPRPRGPDYEAQLIDLRDQVNEARLEDVPPLIEEMERIQQVAARRALVTEGVVDPKSPYFGRLVLEENDRKREVLIGRSTYVDAKTNTRIVDWRDAPVSRIYYRYEEGDDYAEFFGGREVEGDVLTRRSLAIAEGDLRRVGSPQGTFFKKPNGEWKRASDFARKLTGGQGAAMRPEAHHRPGKLGVGADGQPREDKHLPEIAALIDPRQFELITAPHSGLVVIQGGAGSGKTTIGLHRLAYLAFQDKERYRADRMLVIVFNDALARYISRVLPALGVPGVLVTTYERWAHRQRVKHLSGVPVHYDEDTPGVVVRLKKHPAMLKIIDDRVDDVASTIERGLERCGDDNSAAAPAVAAWRERAGLPPAHRVRQTLRWLKEDEQVAALSPNLRHRVERVLLQGRKLTRDVVGLWADLLTDAKALERGLAEHAPGAFTARELAEAHRWCARKCPQIVAQRDTQLDGESAGPSSEMDRGVDGVDEHEDTFLDREDDTLLLRLVQCLRGALGRRRKSLTYEHIFVDEAQDLSPVELSVVLDTATQRRNVTLAGDVAQRLHMYNGFSDWRSLLRDLGLEHVSVEPLKLSYRSTHQIIEFATDILGPLRNEEECKATRDGAPVELFQFTHSGEVVAFLGEALRELMQAEPQTSVAVIARYTEQADLYYKGLGQAEVPFLRRIAEQDFPFKPGVDVTDVRQVKGLEFDYVVLLEVGSGSFPEDHETRHLLHIAATRAAHQLWVTTTGTPSPLLPRWLVDRA